MNPVYFRTDAYDEIGIGHVKRCAALGRALMDTGVPVEFICAEDETTRSIIGSEFLVHWLPDRTNAGRDLESLSAILQACGDRNPLIIVDSYAADDMYFSALRSFGCRIAYFEDQTHSPWEIDLIINGSVGAENAVYQASRALLGPEYILMGPDFWEDHGRPASLQGIGPLSLLITMGGIDHYDLSSKIIDISNGLEQSIALQIVIGPYYENVRNIEEKAADCANEINLIYAPPSLAPHIKSADVAVSAGGSTLYELARYGVPAIGIALWENQRHNVIEFGNRDVILPLHYSPEMEFDVDLEQSIVRILTAPKSREKMSGAGQALVDGCGAIRVAKYVRKWLFPSAENLNIPVNSCT